MARRRFKLTRGRHIAVELLHELHHEKAEGIEETVDDDENERGRDRHHPTPVSLDPTQDSSHGRRCRDWMLTRMSAAYRDLV